MTRWPLVVALAGLLVVAPFAGGVAASSAGGDSGPSPKPSSSSGTVDGRAASLPARASPFEFQSRDFDGTEFTIRVFANGSARWTFEYKETLTNESQVENFEAYAARFNNESIEPYPTFRERAQSLASRGANATGREMTARGFERRAYVTDLGNQGIVEMSFLWTGFAATEGDRVVVGDVFQDGLYIGPNQRLVFEHGPDLAFRNVAPQPDFISPGESLADADVVGWEGERSFIDQRPSLTYAPPPTETPAGGPGTTQPPTTAPPGPTGGDGGDSGIGLFSLIALVVVIALAAGAAIAYRAGALPVGGNTTPGTGTSGAGPGPGGGGGTAAGAGADAGPTISDEELLSDEDRVLRMLDEHGGRMKQVNIVEETGWSKSKVSMLLSEMEEEDQISKLRVGRENIVSLKGHEPDAAGSPFDDEE